VRELPTGTVTLLFTDIEGSTKLLDEIGDRSYAKVLATHRRVLRDAFARHAGVEVDTQGDSLFVAFVDAHAALAAAAEAQATLEGGSVRVRMGVHTGKPQRTAEGYVGIDVHRAARVMAAGHGGQILVSETTRTLVGAEFVLQDLGRHRLKDMTAPQHLFQLGHTEFPPLKTLNATNLPVAASPLLGRERELEELVGLLRDGTRLLTITGPGGIGKTRLALQVAAELTGSFVDGVFWVPLVVVTDPDLVLPTIAQTIGAGGRLKEHLRAKELLLLLDNAEHVVAAAPGIAELLAGAPNVRLLVTSRAPLHVVAEFQYVLEPLRPRDAVTLFVERARRVGRQVDPSGTIEAICRRVDRLPLAIELAAARTRLLAPGALLERLDYALPILTQGARDAPERQRTLKATIEWSYDLLDDEARRVFAGLSVFTGTFALDAAEQICEADLESLSALVDLALAKALDSSRLLLLETVREYATARAEDVGSARELRDRHGDYYLRVAAEAVPNLQGRDAGPTIARVANELPNIRAALSHVALSDPDRALRIAVDLGPFWNARSPYEPLGLLEQLYRPDIEPQLRLEALGALAFFAMDAEQLTKADVYSAEHLALARSLGDPRAIARALPVASLLARRKGDMAAADRMTAEGVELARKLGDEPMIARLYWYRGVAELEYGDPATGLRWSERSLDVYESVGDRHGVAWARFSIGDAQCRLGRWELAREYLKPAVTFAYEAEEWKPLANSLDHLAAVAAATGDPSAAARLRGAADALWRSMSVPLEVAYRPPHLEEAIGIARSALGDEAFERDTRLGAAMSLDEAVALACAP
jgi:predicted ATPase/class 3 adenylate cyclase